MRRASRELSLRHSTLESALADHPEAWGQLNTKNMEQGMLFAAVRCIFIGLLTPLMESKQAGVMDAILFT